MAAIWRICFTFLPSWVQLLFFSLLALLVVIIIVRVVAGILSAIPFL